jgi:hypothetical protein
MENKIQTILNILGISDDLSAKNTIDELYDKITKIRKISEFNMIIIEELIKADIIPPIVLKRSQLLYDIKILKHKLQILSDRYEIFQSQSTGKNILSSTKKEILDIQTEINNKQEELNYL